VPASTDSTSSPSGATSAAEAAAAQSTGDVAGAGQTSGASANDAALPAVDDLNSCNVLGGPEELEQSSEDHAQGWHSAPNLYLTASRPDVPAQESAASQQPPLYTSPLMNREVAAADDTVPVTAVPSPLADVEIGFSSSQQFSLGPIGETPAAESPPVSQVTAPPPPTPPVFAASPSETAPPAVVPSVLATTAVATPGPLTFGAAPAAPPFPTPPSPTPVTSSPLTFGAAPVTPVSAPLTFGAAPAAALPATPTFTAAPPQSASFQTPAMPSPQAPAMTAPTVAQEVAGFAESESQSRQKFLFMLLIIVGSYASAVTIVLVYMLIFGRTSNLESLPDLIPEIDKRTGAVKWNYNAPKNDVAPGHVLSLGQSRRFGNVRVTPLKVTRGRIAFEHFTGEARMGRDPSDPVLKLWVKFENASRDQTFAPLDSYVLFTRSRGSLNEPVKANGFLAVESNRKAGKSIFHMFDAPVQSEFRMIGQNLNRKLAPGDSVEMFIPSEEDAQALSGDLVWRFQFRKGYNPASKRGVTTLIDVRFNSKDIINEGDA
jgi:hypothetical protein